jgi:fructose-1,6-bisphosphatase/inositol monophosphatase family enzyme
MSDRIDPRAFLDAMTLPALQVGAVALQFYGKVANIGKEVDDPYQNELHRRAAQALSDVDLAAQEVLLYALHHHFPSVRVEPEEDTPMAARFAANQSPYTVVLDPIDGTLNYLTSAGQFAVSFGLMEEDRFDAAVVYFPLLGELYRAARGGGVEVLRNDNASEPREPDTRMVFHDTSAPIEALARLTAKGFSTIRSGCSMVDSTVVATGLGAASVCARRPSIRRCIGALISAEAGGHLCDLDGRPYDSVRPDTIDSLVIAPDPETAERLLAAFGVRMGDV